MERITSRNNQLVKDTKRLMTSSRERRDRGLFVLEGTRLVLDVLNSVYMVKTLLLTDAVAEKYPEAAEALTLRAEETFLITEEVAVKLGETQNPQGIFAVCRMVPPPAALGEKIIALDHLQDPANLGAVFRTAEALGIESVITCGCCDIYNPKTLRASMGGVLRIQPRDTDDLAQTLTELKATHAVYATVPDAAALPITEIDFSSPCVCVIGNEANGVDAQIKSLADRLVTIPMHGRAESLNAAAAAAITMWEMLR